MLIPFSSAGQKTYIYNGHYLLKKLPLIYVVNCLRCLRSLGVRIRVRCVRRVHAIHDHVYTSRNCFGFIENYKFGSFSQAVHNSKSLLNNANSNQFLCVSKYLLFIQSVANQYISTHWTIKMAVPQITSSRYK